MSTNTVDEMLASSLDFYLDGDVDGGFSTDERNALEEKLTSDPGLAAEKTRLTKLHALLAEARVPVQADFTARVMAALPQEQVAARSAWRLPLAMMLFMALGAALLLGNSLAENPLVGTGMAVIDFAQTTVLAGSGIVVATWRGAGMGLGELIGSSPMNLAAFGIMVVCLNLLFVSLWRRRPAASKEQV